jgi:preprotein translocase subunit SecG
MSILLGVGTFLLIVNSIILVLLVLMQKTKSDGGMGAAFGGGVAEATFGAETTNVLSKATIYAAIVFFVLSFTLYLGRVYEHNHPAGSGSALPTIAAPLSAPKPMPAPAPSTPAPAAPTSKP